MFGLRHERLLRNERAVDQSLGPRWLPLARGEEFVDLVHHLLRLWREYNLWLMGGAVDSEPPPSVRVKGRARDDKRLELGTSEQSQESVGRVGIVRTVGHEDEHMLK